MLAGILRIAAVVGAVAAALLLLAWLGQRRLLYFAERQSRESAERRARALGLEAWTGASGEILGWRARQAGGAARGRLVVFHGNAGTALDRVYFVEAFARALPDFPLDVYLAEYPGYGPRPGAPAEATILRAAREAIAVARRDGPGPVLVAGESLGSAVAALAAAEEPAAVDGLLLVTPLASVPAVASRHYRIVPRLVHRDTWRADLALPRYGGKVAFLVAGRDEVVFTDLGLALHEAYPGPKWLHVDEGAGHNTVTWFPSAPWIREAAAFLLGPSGR